jgi:type I restriction enzyme S subunit
VVIFRPGTGLPSRFLSICLLADPVLRWITSQAKATAGQHNISVSMSRALPLPLPPLDEQSEIAAEVDRRLSVADAAEAQVEHALQRAARLRQSILKRAFEGRLVDQDPSDEPAATLLERIKAATGIDSSLNGAKVGRGRGQRVRGIAAR